MFFEIRCPFNKNAGRNTVEVALYMQTKTKTKTKLHDANLSLPSMCSQPITDCIQISFHYFKHSRFFFLNQGTGVFTSHCGDVKFLLQSQWASARRREAPVSTGYQKAFRALEFEATAAGFRINWKCFVFSLQPQGIN